MPVGGARFDFSSLLFMGTVPAPLSPPARKVMLIGWDAADWKIIDPLLARGEMPNLQRLISRGVRGDMRTLAPVFSPVLWTSIATGKRSFKHGIHGFTEPAPGGVGIQPISNLSRRTKAVWNMLHQAGKTSQVIGWWPSHPAEPIRGVMVSNQFQLFRRPLREGWPVHPGSVQPPSLADKLEPYRIHTEDLTIEQLAAFVPRVREIDHKTDGRLETLAKIIAETSTIQAVTTALMQLEPWDFLATYFDGIDHFCHGFMRYHPPRQAGVTERDGELYGEVIRGAYRFFDLMLGVQVELAGAETTFIVMSDHGFHSDHLRPESLPATPGGPAAEHREHGIFVMAGPGVRQGGERLRGLKLLDVCPTILTLFGLPIGGDMDGAPILEAFDRPVTARTIPSWDEVPGPCGAHPPDTLLDPVQSEESLRQLIALGYVDPLGEDQEENRRRTINELRFSKAISYLDAGYAAPASAILAELWADEKTADSRYAVSLVHALLGLKKAGAAREVFTEMLGRKNRKAGQARRRLYEQVCAQLGEAPRDEVPEPPVLQEMFKRVDWRNADEKTRMEMVRIQGDIGVNAAAWLLLETQILQAEGREDQALAKLSQVATQDTAAFLPLRLKKGELCLRMRRNDEALSHFDAVLALAPQDAAAHLGRARILLRLERFEEAAEAALASAELDQNQTLANLVLGIALSRLDKLDQARRALELAVAMNPDSAVAHRHLARLFTRLRDHDRAYAHETLARRAFARRDDAARLAAAPAEASPSGESGRAASPAQPNPLRRELDAPEQEIITVVSGLPRSGTSMMMQMLEACGVPILSDAHRPADSDNPRGYFEFESAKALRTDAEWVGRARGKGVKIVAQLLPYLPENYSYRVVFMVRDLSEVIASQRAMLDRLGRHGGKIEDQDLFKVFHQQVNRVKTWLAFQPNISTMIVHYADAIARPAETAAAVAGFLKREVDAAKVAAVVDARLHRQRR